MQSDIEKLLSELPECKSVWKIFLDLVKVPRGSFNSTHILPFFQKFCEEHVLDYSIDEGENLIIRFPASEGCEDKPGILLQGHWDIVNQKNDDVEIDFKNDPLVPRIVEKDGKKWVMATGTSLGADDGIGLAMALSIAMDKELKHGPIEVLATANEEVGLIGASALKPGCLKSKYLINIDSEDYGVLTVSCAGGFNSEFTLDIDYEDMPENYTTLNIIAKGFCGGHSGVEINKPLGNAIKAMTRLLRTVFACDCARIVSVNGGSAHNAIPRDTSAKIAIPKDKIECVKEKLEAEFAKMKTIYAHTDSSATLVLNEDSEFKGKVVTLDISRKLISFMTTLPANVLRMSPDIEGLVETSFMEAIVKTDVEKNQFYILGSGRSSYDFELDEIYQTNAFMAKTLGFKCSPMLGRYGAWPVDTSSKLTKITCDEWKSEIGSDIKVEAIHAGLECGCIIKTHPTMDAVSIGPTILQPHSPMERLEIDTVVPVYKVIERVVRKISE